MKQLLYTWIESVNNRAQFWHQGIQFSNDYIVTLNWDIDAFSGITISEKKSNIYINFFGENIIDISAFVGINGVGKTTILDILGSPRNIRKQYMNEWRYFNIYKVDDLYVIEGNGKDIIEDFVEKIPVNAHDEFSFLCQYNEGTKKLIFIRYCSESGEIEKSIKFFYFRDRPNNEQKYMREVDVKGMDYNVCFERIDMKQNPSGIYRTFSILKDEEQLNLNMKGVMFEVSPDIEFTIRLATDDRKENVKEVFIIEMLLAVVTKINAGKKAVEDLPIDENGIFEYNSSDFEKYKERLCLAISEDKYWESENVEIAKLVELLEGIPNSFFKVPTNYIQKFGMTVKLSFANEEEFSQELYGFLMALSEYIIFTYSGISAGEKKVLDVFSGIFSYINKIGKDDITDESTSIIILDEPDKGLHPEMSRRFISSLVKMLNNKKDKKSRYQIIISTHSPFLISDIPIPYIHCLKYKKIEGKKDLGITEIVDSSIGLLNSIPDIMKDTFFMESPFGEFGNQYFKALANQIQALEEVNNEQIAILKQKIISVNDQVLRKYLEKTLEKKIDELGNTMKKLTYYEEQLAYYEKKINELRGR